MNAAMIPEPPSPAKLDLIRRLLRASGLQADIDRGGFLDTYGRAGSQLFKDLAEARPDLTLGDAMQLPMEHLRQAYLPHRQVWQDEYEGHLNWEFTEDELREIVAFLESTSGQHYLTARWRMNAYISTNTEGLVDEIIREARRRLGLS
ncbi:DUF2059 domain-containing protein [Phenylobacterium sp. SCN 70-31]|uniref:DUF2059 domain-containing protein n=1 Tax=Phenylobacterium sp. SCN 70-31 TaxID=1660129 RepID=UPI0025EFCA74|nr:DUF2059 domain-containing protein [Phenylobacterium sp. SCN 70-31]